MFSRVFLAAGVAALAISAPASAQKGGHGGGNGKGGGEPAAAQGGSGGDHGNGGGGNPNRGGGGGGGQAMFQGGGDRGHGGGGFERQQMRQVERQQMRQVERQQSRGFERQQMRQVERQQSRGFERQQMRQAERQQSRGFERQQARHMERQQARGFERQQARQAERQQARNFDPQHGFDRQQAKIAQREQMRMNRAQQNLSNQQQFAVQHFRDQQFRGENGGKFANRAFAEGNWAPAYQAFAYNDVQVAPYQQVTRFVGSPLAALSGFNLSPLPTSIQYLYPDNNDYYYRYGDGYLYQVDRGDNLIASLIPLLGGGYMPGQYLPASYMNSYVPDYYGFNSFYPDYNDVCNRYYDGVVYQVDCDDGYVENVIPMYAGGYGVGQLLPSSYSYYNVPTQYRSMYYDTPDYGYWYSPGAIYQYDNRSSMITSVAALLSPGFSIGQPIPTGYDIYNVPYQYRSTYYDTDDAWYRYNNGYIYQVDPTTQLVTAIVASLLT